MDFRLSSMIIVSLIGHSAMLWMPVPSTEQVISAVQETPQTIQVTLRKAVKKVQKSENSLLPEVAETPQVVEKEAETDSNLVEAESQPQLTKNVSPRYPKMAQRKGYEGTVILNIEVLENGHCGKVTVLQSSGYAILDRSAITAVKKWEFSPALRNGSPVIQTVELPISFKLDQT